MIACPLGAGKTRMGNKCLLHLTMTDCLELFYWSTLECSNAALRQPTVVNHGESFINQNQSFRAILHIIVIRAHAQNPFSTFPPWQIANGRHWHDRKERDRSLECVSHPPNIRGWGLKPSYSPIGDATCRQSSRDILAKEVNSVGPFVAFHRSKRQEWMPQLHEFCSGQKKSSAHSVTTGCSWRSCYNVLLYLFAWYRWFLSKNISCPLHWH